MMERANQTPAFDAVRIQVGGGNNNNGAATAEQPAEPAEQRRPERPRN